MEKVDTKRSIFAFLFRILGFITGCTAITLQLLTNANFGKGFMANHVLAYFTIQTNILSTFVFLYLIIKSIVYFVKDKELSLIHMNPSVHLACTFYITITLTVYWTMLAPVLGVGDAPLMIANTLFLHLFTPLMAIIDCVLFFEHGKLTKKDPAKWLLYPVLYLVSVIIIANVSDVPYYQFKVGDKVISLMYPYPFLEPQIVGIWGMIGIMILLLLLVYGLGLLYVYIDKKLVKLDEKLNNKSITLN